MQILSTLFSKASGSAGGITAVPTRQGTIFRTRASPTGGPSTRQTAIRAHFGTLASRWANTLTDLQRHTWNFYALHVKRKNRLGDARNVGGYGMYIRSNVPRLVAAVGVVDEAPTVFDLGGFTQIWHLRLYPDADAVVFFIEPNDDWANEDGAFMLIYTAPPVSPATAFYKGTFRFARFIRGRSAQPPAFLQYAINPFPFSAGQRVYWRVQITRADGRYSVSQTVNTTNLM